MSFEFKHVKLEVPIIQGGMGIGVSLSNLAGHVMKEGGLGVLSAAQPGYRKDDFKRNTVKANIEALKEEVKKAREIANGNGALGINLMVAMEYYGDYAKSMNDLDIDVVISGAGLPLDLPTFITNPKIALAPIVSSAKAAVLLCKRWLSRHNVLPDLIIIEGPMAGGHLGFDPDELRAKTTQTLEEIVVETKAALEALGHKIPIAAAGGVFTGYDIAKFLKLGADAVQMATRFIGTYECDADMKFKEVFLNGKEEDIDLVISPAGYHGRAWVNPFVKKMRTQRIPPIQCVNCLKPCHPPTTPYCITEALIEAVKGNTDEGLVFTGSNGYRVKKLYHVHDLITELLTEMKAGLAQ